MPTIKNSATAPLVLASLVACTELPRAELRGPDDPAGVDAPGTAVQPAPPATARLGVSPPIEKLTAAFERHFAGHIGRRIYVQIDKPTYQPTETIWIRSWDLRLRDGAGHPSSRGLTYSLISPKGATVLTKRVAVVDGVATNDLVVPDGVQGGEYTLRVASMDGVSEERPVIISTYEPPRIKKRLEMVRKAYGAGDEVTATIEVKRPTGEPLANHPLTGLVRLDGADLPRVSVRTDATGAALVGFRLPDQIQTGDGLLTVLVEDGGVTESVTRRIPIVLSKMQLSFFPEGGDLIEGLPSRLYFSAKNTLGKPADVKGRVVDDHGQAVATFSSYDRGLGRLDFTPSTGRKYHAEVTQPVGVTERYPLPLSKAEGCVLTSYDDLEGSGPAIRVAVRCHDARTVIVAAMLRERLLDAAAVAVPAGAPAVVYLAPKDEALVRMQGVARITVFDEALSPLAERVVFRNRRGGINVTIEPDAKQYTPRGQVALTVRTTDAAGKAVPAELAVSVVDDTVISYADDKTGHILSRLLLEPELPSKIEEPKFYFDTKKEKSALAMELLMGTSGWRRFEWRPVLTPVVTRAQTAGALKGDEGGVEHEAIRRRPRRGAPPPPRAAPLPAAAPPPEVAAKPMAPPKKMPVAKDQPMQANRGMDKARRGRRIRADTPLADLVFDGALDGFGADNGPMGFLPADEAMAGAEDADWFQAKRELKEKALGWAPVRVFAVPDYSGAQDGPRTDFRETVFWSPAVKTDRTGKATFTFYLSDAVTSFRVFAEGAGGGLIGRQEAVLASRLPFSLSAKLPLAVSAGDRIDLPITLTNETGAALSVAVGFDFGALLALEGAAPKLAAALGANDRESLFYALRVTGKRGMSKVRIQAVAGGLYDEVIREIRVDPLGFPQSASRSGTISDRATTSVDLAGAMAGTVQAKLTFYPSPIASMVSGLEGMLREPSGCFEQTSSTNYPNVMVLQYMQTAGVAAPALAARTGKLLDRGYRKLVGFETKNKGYEWFGHSPPHEALTAYGLLEFADMKAVYGGVDEAMMARTAEWLKARRDGKGGFKRDAKALDSFGRADADVTNAYIIYALAEAGLTAGMTAEIEATKRAAASSSDPYVLALAANALLVIGSERDAGLAATKRLIAMQTADGHWRGAKHSITRSTGENLHIETTALAVMAVLGSALDPSSVRRGVSWLNEHRGGYGQWGATQATVLALKALSRYAASAAKTRSAGTITVLINGKRAGHVAYPAGRTDPIELTDLATHLTAGTNTIVIEHTGSGELPWSMAVDYASLKPATHPGAAVALETALERTEVPMGETVRLNATITNRTSDGQPMTIARIGLPGGLTFQTWQLKELKDEGRIAFYETRQREVVLYFRQMKPSEVKRIPIDLVATVPGAYTSPASSAYLYYTNDQKFWAPGLAVQIAR